MKSKVRRSFQLIGYRMDMNQETQLVGIGTGERKRQEDQLRPS